MSEPKVKIYESNFCPYCVAAKQLFTQKGVDFETVDVSGDHEARRWLVSVTGQRTVPQIFIGEKSIGGYTEARALERSGELDQLLGRAG